MLHTLATLPSAPAEEAFTLYALCAQWCGTCREYRQLLEEFSAQQQDLRVVWVDVEDDADAVDSVDVENFPTLLITRGQEARFFGVVLPTRAALVQTLRAVQDSAAACTSPEAATLAAALTQ